jgi:hypothetical protein
VHSLSESSALLLTDTTLIGRGPSANVRQAPTAQAFFFGNCGSSRPSHRCIAQSALNRWLMTSARRAGWSGFRGSTNSGDVLVLGALLGMAMILEGQAAPGTATWGDQVLCPIECSQASASMSQASSDKPKAVGMSGGITVSTGKSPAYGNPVRVDWPVTDFFQRSLQTAAAGRHHVLLIGPQPLVTSFYANHIIESLPSPTSDESSEIATNYAAAGLRVDSRVRPVRVPDPTIAMSRFIHCASAPRLGELGLAAHGVLLLRELPAFAPSVLERIGGALLLERPVLRARSIAGGRGFPQVVATMSPCPCGRLGNPYVESCTCSPDAIAEQVRQIPLTLRSAIDITLAVPFLEPNVRESFVPSVESRRERIAAAWSYERNLECTVSPLSRLTGDALFCVQSFTGSARREGEFRSKLVRVAATIANLAGTIGITDTDVRAAALLVLPMCTFGER